MRQSMAQQIKSANKDANLKLLEAVKRSRSDVTAVSDDNDDDDIQVVKKPKVSGSVAWVELDD